MKILNKVALNIGSGIYQVPLIKKLKRLGFVVLSTDINPNAPGLKYSDIKLITNSQDYKNLYKLIYKKKIKPAIIISGAASCLITSAYLSKKFELNYCANTGNINDSETFSDTIKTYLRSFT